MALTGMEMTAEAFWDLLQRAAERPDERERTEYVVAELLRLPARCAGQFREHLLVARHRVDTPGLRAAARVVLGGPLVHDAYWEFHLWLLSLGGPAVGRAVADPDSLAEVPRVRALAGGWAVADHPGWASLAAAVDCAPVDCATTDCAITDCAAMDCAVTDCEAVDCAPAPRPVAEGPTPPLPRLTALFGATPRPARNESDAAVVTVVW
ncbi:DUF4240 domain-containing protein [Actinokineospora sp. 24-640]